MKILAIEGSAMVASVALLEDDTIVAEYTLNYKKTHSQTLMPMIDALMKMTDTMPENIDAIAVAKGPGSFTGLRIAAATAKGLGMAIDKPIISVPTIDAMAVGHMDSGKLICPMIDARRSHVYTGLYEFVDGNISVIREADLVAAEDLADIINELGREVVFLGDGLKNNAEILKSKLNVAYNIANATNNIQRATYVALLGKKYFDEGINVFSANDFLPDYLRESQAERELKNKQ